MTISEKKMQIVIDNYFKSECDVNTSIRQAFEKGFRIGIKKLPPAQPELPKGKWIDNETSYADGVRQTCTCSICGQRSVRPLGRFCRWCGADMRGEQND